MSNRKHNRLTGSICLICCIALILCLSGCSKFSVPGNTGASGSNSSSPHKTTFFAMDTAMSITAYGDDSLFDGKTSPLDEARELILSLESKLSVMDENSIIYKINHADGNEVQVDAETGGLLERTLDLCRRTDGALDITIYPVVRAWGFTTGVYRVPGDEELYELLKKVDYKKIRISLTSNTDSTADTADNKGSEKNGSAADIASAHYSIFVENGMMLDLGAAAKGYAAEKTADLLKKSGISSAVISLGGNIKTIGTKPDGSDWNIAIASPFVINSDDAQGLSSTISPSAQSGYAGILKVSNKSVVTSGGYERYFEENGKHYCHIIDPSSGCPVDNGVLSVTIVAEDSFLCDALSTALFVMGAEKTADYWRSSLKSNDFRFDYIMITDDGMIYITEGIKDSFTVDTGCSDIFMLTPVEQ